MIFQVPKTLVCKGPVLVKHPVRRLAETLDSIYGYATRAENASVHQTQHEYSASVFGGFRVI